MRKQYIKHHYAISYFEEFELATWDYMRVVTKARDRRWGFVQIIADNQGSWPLVTVIGEDSTGSINRVSIHRRLRRWLHRLLEGRLAFEAGER